MFSRLVAHLDMNSFFATVEQQANPFLRGRPVGVCAYLHRNGCVIAASVEAKQLGMKVGMTMQEARERVPNVVFVQNEPAKYRAVTSRIFSILHELTDRVEHYSIDEAFLDLTGWYRDHAEAAWALTRARRRIYAEVGEWLHCSIGIAQTRFLAKLASDYQKPCGLTVVTPENLDEVLASLDLEDICGIGPRMRRRIARLGYATPLELKRAPLENLLNAFGQYGYTMWMKLNGQEVEDVVSEAAPPKSIGHSHCIPNSVNREGRVEAVLTKLTERAARRLRHEKLLAGSVFVSVGLRGDDVNGWYGGGGGEFFRLDEPADDSFTLAGAARELLYELWDGREPVRFLAVTFTELCHPSGQLKFGVWDVGRGTWDVGREREQTMERLACLSKAADLVRDKHGEESISLGGMFRLSGEYAPDRIGFRKTDGVVVKGVGEKSA